MTDFFMKKLIFIFILLALTIICYGDNTPNTLSINLLAENKIIIIDKTTFNQYENIEDIILPKTLKYISPESFSNITNVGRIFFNDYTEFVSEYAFINCNIKHVDVVNQITREVIYTRNNDYSYLNFYYSDILYNWGLIQYNQIILGETHRNPYIFLNDGRVNLLYSYFEPKYKSKDGILFNYNGSKLIYYPNCKENECYIIPKTVKELGIAAFNNNNNNRQSFNIF